MIVMKTPRKNQTSSPAPAEHDQEPYSKQFNLRIPVKLLDALKEMAEENLTGLTTEIIAACLDRVKAAGKWPRKE
jgi:predicted HicB family RNase H-like nuclease